MKASRTECSPQVRRLRELADGGLAELEHHQGKCRSLVKHDLIDEYRLMVLPVMLGSGERLFRDMTDVTHLELVDTRTFESGVTVLTYRPADRVPSSKYVETFAWTREQIRLWQATQNADRVLATV